MNTQSLKGTELLNHIYEAQKGNFQQGMPSFHNLLWQLIVNEAWKENKPHCFTPIISQVVGADGYELAIVEHGESGYWGSKVFFQKDINFWKANEICDQINEELFGLLPKATCEIVATTMRYIKAG